MWPRCGVSRGLNVNISVLNIHSLKLRGKPHTAPSSRRPLGDELFVSHHRLSFVVRAQRRPAREAQAGRYAEAGVCVCVCVCVCVPLLVCASACVWPCAATGDTHTLHQCVCVWPCDCVPCTNSTWRQATHTHTHHRHYCTNALSRHTRRGFHASGLFQNAFTHSTWMRVHPMRIQVSWIVVGRGCHALLWVLESL